MVYPSVLCKQERISEHFKCWIEYKKIVSLIACMVNIMSIERNNFNVSE